MFGFEFMVQFVADGRRDLCCDANKRAGLNLCDVTPALRIVCPAIQALSMIATARTHSESTALHFFAAQTEACLPRMKSVRCARSRLTVSAITEHPSVIDLIQIKGGCSMPAMSDFRAMPRLLSAGLAGAGLLLATQVSAMGARGDIEGGGVRAADHDLRHPVQALRRSRQRDRQGRSADPHRRRPGSGAGQQPGRCGEVRCARYRLDPAGLLQEQYGGGRRPDPLGHDASPSSARPAPMRCSTRSPTIA